MKEVATTFATVTLIPTEFTIIVTPPAEHPEQIKEIGTRIDNQGLNFQIEPVEENRIEGVQNQLQMTEKLLKLQKEETEKFRKWWTESENKVKKIQEQVKSINILLGSIFPAS